MMSSRLSLLGIVLLAFVLSITVLGCGPDKASVSNTIQQTVQATNMSLLSQVDWKQITTAMRGSIGPEFVAEVEAYVKQSAGVIVRVHGGSLGFETTGNGTGGRDNSAMMPALLQVQQRWENADDEHRRNRDYWTGQVIDALKADWESRQAAKRATTQPASQPATQPAATPAASSDVSDSTRNTIWPCEREQLELAEAMAEREREELPANHERDPL